MITPIFSDELLESRVIGSVRGDTFEILLFDHGWSVVIEYDPINPETTPPLISLRRYAP